MHHYMVKNGCMKKGCLIWSCFMGSHESNLKGNNFGMGNA